MLTRKTLTLAAMDHRLGIARRLFHAAGFRRCL